MILVYHKNNRISRVISENKAELLFDSKATIAEGLSELALQFPKSKMGWCKEVFQEYLNVKEMDSLFHHNKMMLSYNPTAFNYLGKKIGYIEESPFINVNKKVTYPTWQMSSVVGVIHASLLLEINNKIKKDTDFDYYLNSVAKICMPLGLICYSEPRLLRTYEANTISKQASIYTLFKFVKQHYKPQWILLLLLNFMVYERKLQFLPFLYAVLIKKRSNNNINLDDIVALSSLKVVKEATIDVIIPTIGRCNYLYDVLCDLRRQTHLPKNVIIVEQNPLPGSASDLDYLQSELWPFAIKHTFTHQVGACNARNIALGKVESEWVFLNDDDNRFEIDLIEKIFLNIIKFGIIAVTTSYLQINEKQNYKVICQSGIFGSGNSFLKTEALNKVSFNESLEFGYGEDADFGLQLRNNGVDIIYFPEPSILHLKAPIGGFRIKNILAWEKEEIQPKPSPTVMLYQKLHTTQEQINGYKLVFFIKSFKNSGWKNPMQFLSSFQKKWEASLYWAKQLENK